VFLLGKPPQREERERREPGVRVRNGTGFGTGSGASAGGGNSVGTGVGIDRTGLGAMSAGTGTRADTGVGNETGTDGCTDFGTGSCINFGACTGVGSITSLSISLSPRLLGDSTSDSDFKPFGFQIFPLFFFFFHANLKKRFLFKSDFTNVAPIFCPYFVFTYSLNGPLWLLLSFVSSEGL
jgi:hypothetical protein